MSFGIWMRDGLRVTTLIFLAYMREANRAHFSLFLVAGKADVLTIDTGIE
jgi:hypothetical protein